MFNDKYKGKTALILAVEKENEEIVQMILEKYTPVTVVNDKYKGKTALFLAVEKDNEEIVEMVLKKYTPVTSL